MKRLLPKTTLKLNDCQWRATDIKSEVGRAQLAANGLHWQSLFADGSALYTQLQGSKTPISDSDAAAVFESMSAVEALLDKPIGKCKLMAIVNLTTDSFSDGGNYQTDANSLRLHCEKLIDDGAAILDLGAESTRPGADEVDASQQIELMSFALDAIEGLDVPLSIDTRSAEVANYCLQRGAIMVNDVSALSDPQMASVVAEHQAQLVLMHRRGDSKTMQSRCDYDYLLGEICDELKPKIDMALEAGVSAESIIVDPGIGFSKTATQNFEIIKHMDVFRSLGYAVLSGPSRKSFIASVLPELEAAERDCATIGAASISAFHGAEYLRLHCGGGNWDAVKIAQACR
ncbi:MAG: dihydropteroate synthase [Planctomycetota bacterium]|nr:dihydropteroate synthase [Planctomycetota bacterium]